MWLYDNAVGARADNCRGHRVLKFLQFHFMRIYFEGGLIKKEL